MLRILSVLMCLLVSMAGLCGANETQHPCCHQNKGCSHSVTPLESHRAVHTADLAAAVPERASEYFLPAWSFAQASLAAQRPVFRSLPALILRL